MTTNVRDFANWLGLKPTHVYRAISHMRASGTWPLPNIKKPETYRHITYSGEDFPITMDMRHLSAEQQAAIENTLIRMGENNTRYKRLMEFAGKERK